MGALLSRWDDCHPIALLGLDSAGKTTFMMQMRDRFPPKDSIDTRPTIGFDINDQWIMNRNTKLFDMGGQERTRRLWLDYVAIAEVVVYIIDITDRDRWELAIENLTALLLSDFTTMQLKKTDESKLATAPILILYNKVDIISDQKLKEILPSIRACVRKNLNDLYAKNPLMGPHEVRDLPCSLLKGWGAKEIEQTLAYYLYIYSTSWWMSLLVPSNSLQPSPASTLIMEFDEKTNYPSQ